MTEKDKREGIVIFGRWICNITPWIIVWIYRRAIPLQGWVVMVLCVIISMIIGAYGKSYIAAADRKSEEE